MAAAVRARRALAAAACGLLGAGCGAPDGVLPRREPTLRVELSVDTAQVEISSTAGAAVRAGSRVLLRLAAGERVRARVERGRVVIARPGRAAARHPGPLEVRAAGGGLVAVGGRRYRGVVELRAVGPGRLAAVNRVPLEAYLRGVVPVEMGPVGRGAGAALRAQAVAARTYAVGRLAAPAGSGFHLRDGVRDQVYGGAGAERAAATEAVRETAGEVLVHDGRPIEAFYHSTCAGRTVGPDEAWGRLPRPYLSPLDDVDPRTRAAYDLRSSRFRWTVRWTGGQLQEVLAETLRDSLPGGAPLGAVHDVRVLRRTRSGRVGALQIVADGGRFTVRHDALRWVLRGPEGAPLHSARFDLALRRDGAGKIVEVTARGAGWGHGVGMCQFGAIGRSLAGQDYRTILGAYYRGAQVRDLY
ncbi:MAG TPA: SpoIID/LytB domain-containing protein [Longimicrobium sp.]|nr:SpoIID/LytB domain-containing protein [Longimicrobium sp.]